MDPLPGVGPQGLPPVPPRRAGGPDAPPAVEAGTPGMAADRRAVGGVPGMEQELQRPRIEDVIVEAFEKASDVDQEIFARWMLEWAREQKAWSEADWRLRMIPPEQRDELKAALRRMAADPDGGVAGATALAREFLPQGKQG